MEFDIDFEKFCYNCGGRCCNQSSWWINGRLISKGDLRKLEINDNIKLIPRNDWGFRCGYFNKSKCEIYENRPNVCKEYICENPIFKILEVT